MPGVNCSVLGCGSCRRTKGLGIFKLPVAKDDAHRKWRNEWLGELTKAREIDQDFREQIKNDKVHTCEKHFKPKDIETCKYRCIFSQTIALDAVCVHNKKPRTIAQLVLCLLFSNSRYCCEL